MRTLTMLLTAILCIACCFVNAAPEKATKKLLYITKTGGFHHGACEASIPVFKKLAAESKCLEVTNSAGTELINAEDLKKFDGIIFSNTSGNKKQFGVSDANLTALIDAVKSGKAFIGIHAATDTLGDYPPYYEMIGGTFNGHPWHKRVKINIEDPAHPAASCVPSPWYVTDEIYSSKNYSRDKLHVIMSLDVSEEKNKGNREDRDYALAWCKPFGKGRVFYTALGHRVDKEVWQNPTYHKHLMGGVLWALGIEPKGKSGETHKLAVGHKNPNTKWEKIFDGKTLNFGTDWETTDNKEVTRKHWTVQPGGILKGEGNGASHLYYLKKKYKNFEYRADVCVSKNGNSGMYFRCHENNLRGGRWKNWPNGYEAQVNNAYHRDPKRSGTFYGKVALYSKDIAKVLNYDPDKDNDDFWFQQHVIAVDNHIIIKLNGQVVVDHFDNGYKEGYFAFQLHHPGMFVKYKNIEVRELP